MELVIVGVVALLVGAAVGALGRGSVVAGRSARRQAEFDVERTRWEVELKSAQDHAREFDAAVQAKSAAESALTALQTSSAVLQTRVDTQAGEIERLRGDLRDTRGKLESSQSEVGKLQKAVTEQEGLARAKEEAVRDRDSRLQRIEEELKGVRGKLESAQTDAGDLRAELGKREAAAASEAKAWQGKLDILMQARTELGNQFTALATAIFDEQSKKFGTDSAKAINALLDPVKTKLGEFQTKVEHFQTEHQTTASALQNELKHLGEVSTGMTQEASRLTHALTTQSQVRGAWGEQVLRRVLEVAGLREGQDFSVQEVHRLADGSLPRPDVIVNLPDGRRIVVDSKLSLVDYVAHTVAETEDARTAMLKRHVAAVRQHIRELSDKDYTQLLGRDTLDFVIAFVPIEQAYLAAVEADNGLYDEAWQRRVMFACPSTLLYALRIVSYLWTQAAQQRNVEDIVKRGADLYDKFVGFTTDLLAVGAALEKAHTAYDAAVNKLSTGRGNAVRQVEMLRELGVKPSKQIPVTLLDRADSVEVPALLASVSQGEMTQSSNGAADRAK